MDAGRNEECADVLTLDNFRVGRTADLGTDFGQAQAADTVAWLTGSNPEVGAPDGSHHRDPHAGLPGRYVFLRTDGKG